MSRKNGGIIGPANTPVGGLFKGVAGGVWRMNDVANFVSNSQWPKAPENIENSLRFDDASSDYLTRTPSSATSRTTWTWSAWVKRSDLAPTSGLFEAYADSNNFTYIRFAPDYIRIFNRIGGSTKAVYNTTALFRDVSAWYHIVWTWDTTNGTAGDRSRLYVNGTRITDFSTETNPTSSEQSFINNNDAHYIGSTGQPSLYLNGSMAEVVFIDGQALEPTSFGETDSTTGIWKPKKIGAFASAGDNSFYLDFKDSSNVGKDVSGLGNNFTVNNLTSIDQATDTCVENFATLNPLIRNKSYNDGTLAEGNLKFAPDGRAISCSTIGVTKGKWYAEFKAQDAGALYIGCGQLRGIDALSDGGLSNPIWYDNNPGYAVGYGAGGSLEDGTASTSYGSGYSDNDIVGVALDMDNYEMYISVNGTFQNSGDPTSGSSKTGGVTGATSYNPFDDGPPIFFFVSDFSAAGVGECLCNFGNPPYSISSGNSDANGHGNFEYSVPSGYYALNTSNLNTYG